MARPKYGYKLNDGTSAPGVTTIIKRFDDQNALINWANKIGREGKTLAQVRNEAFKDGTDVHECFENVVIKRRLDHIPEKMSGMVQILRDYLNGLQVKSFLSELSLVSEIYRFGGTLDLFLETKTEGDILFDFKFAKMVPISNAYQMAGYKVLMQENQRRDVKTGKVFQIDKVKFLKALKEKRYDDVVVNLYTFDLDKFTPTFLEFVELYHKVKDDEDEFKATKPELLKTKRK